MKKKESTISYQIIKDGTTIVATKNSLQEAIDTAIKLSNTCSSLFFIRTVKTEIDDISCYQLGKIKY